jgi:hypothetical protein
MIARRDTLEQALGEVEMHVLSGASTVVVSRGWWDSLSAHERDVYRGRAERAGIELRADDALSSHFVEVRSEGEQSPPLSTEHPT